MNERVTTQEGSRPLSDSGVAEESEGVRPIDVTSVVDQAAGELRRLIVSGALAPGSPILLRDIAAKLGVSFIPVREALRRLEAQGLVVTRPGRSAEVAPLDREDLHAIYRLRLRIEPEIAGRASTQLTASDLRHLEDLLASYATADDLETRWDLHREFHLALLHPAATPWDIRTLHMLWDAGDRYVRHAFDRRSEDPRERRRRVDSHRALLRAVSSGDAQLAVAATLDHLQHNEQVAIAVIEATASASEVTSDPSARSPRPSDGGGGPEPRSPRASRAKPRSRESSA